MNSRKQEARHKRYNPVTFVSCFLSCVLRCISLHLFVFPVCAGRKAGKGFELPHEMRQVIVAKIL